MTTDVQAGLDGIDRQMIGYARPEDHRWLVTEHQGFVYRRGLKLSDRVMLDPAVGRLPCCHQKINRRS